MPGVRGFGIGATALCAAVLATSSAPIDAGERRSLDMFRSGGSHLGAVLRDVESGDVSRLKLPDERGAVVKEVVPDSPAQKAGLEEGDVVVRYQGQDVFSVAQLVRMVRETPAGRKVTLEVNRDGATQRLSATLDARRGGVADDLLDGLGHLDVPMPPMPPERPEAPQPPLLRGKDRALLRDFFVDRGPRKLGIQYQEISGQLAKYFRVEGDSAILVAEVEPEGPAGKAGMKAGDLIVKVNGKAVKDSGELLDELAKLSADQEATIGVQREGRPVDLKVKIGGRRGERWRRGSET